MKKYILIFIILLVPIYIVFNNKADDNYIDMDGIKVAMTLDGNPITEFPAYTSSKKYLVKTKCRGGDGSFRPVKAEDGSYSLKLVISNIEKDVICNLTFTTKTANDTLINVVKEEAQTKDESYGYRYTGKDPNNYVLFNNELYRIVGVLPVAVNSAGTSTNNLVKIVRNDTFGVASWHTTSNTTVQWSKSTIFTLLNSKFYGAVEDSGGVSGEIDTNFSEIGIVSTDYYGKMIKKVYWPSNPGSYDLNVRYGNGKAWFDNEKAARTYANVGLLQKSDAGLAVDESNYDCVFDARIEYSNFAKYCRLVDNWLNTSFTEWALPHNTMNTGFASTTFDETWQEDKNFYRPAMYLNASVYVIGGLGTHDDPYILGM